MIINNTPIEKYFIKGKEVFVKREDLSCPPPGPPFAKVRGLHKHLSTLKKAGITTVGYTETAISMAGWGVAWMAKELGMKAIIYSPQYKKILPILEFHRSKWIEHGAILIPIKAGMAKVNYNICKKHLFEEYPNSVMLPLGLPFQETIMEVATEALRSNIHEYASIVVCVGSGTMCAGLLKALKYSADTKWIYGIFTRSGSIPNKCRKIHTSAGFSILTDFETHLILIDPGWKYSDGCWANLPFPSHPYYDIKSIAWMVDNLHDLKPPILFWNIGALPEENYAEMFNMRRIKEASNSYSSTKTQRYYENVLKKVSWSRING